MNTDDINTIVDRMQDRPILKQRIKDEIKNFYTKKCKSKVDVKTIRPHIFGSWYDNVSDKHFFCVTIETSIDINGLLLFLKHNSIDVEESATKKLYSIPVPDALPNHAQFFLSIKGDWDNG